jgi:hypothetical protein
MTHLIRVRFAVAAIGLVVITTALIVGRAISNAGARESVARSTPRINSMLIEHFGIFRTHHGRRAGTGASRELLPFSRAYSVRSTKRSQQLIPYTNPGAFPRWIATEPDMSMSQARFVAVGNGVWVVPGAQQVCISSGGGGGCQSPTSGPGPSADEGGLFVTQGPSVEQQNTIFGLAPDGNSTVTIGFAGDSSQRVPVVDNVYAADGPDPVSITLRNASGSLTTLNFDGS